MAMRLNFLHLCLFLRQHQECYEFVIVWFLVDLWNSSNLDESSFSTRNLYITFIVCLCFMHHSNCDLKNKFTSNTGGRNLLWIGPCLAVLSSACPRMVTQRMQCSKIAPKCAKGGPSCSVEDTNPTAALCQERACAFLYVAPLVWCFSPANELPDARSISWKHLGDTYMYWDMKSIVVTVSAGIMGLTDQSCDWALKTSEYD